MPLHNKRRIIAHSEQAGLPNDLPDNLPHGSLAHALHMIRPAFDAESYAFEYPDVEGDFEALLLHFCERGWREGRNPHPGFDTVSYLATHADVARIGWNPFYHYVLAGKAEHRAVTPAFLPRTAAMALLGVDPGDCVALLRSEMDERYYASRFKPPLDDSLDLTAHFAFRGWLEERNPNRLFNVHAALSRRPELRAARVNPLVAEIVSRPATPEAADADDPGLRTTRFQREQLFGIGARLKDISKTLKQQWQPGVSRYADPVERLVADSLERGFYLSENPDVGLNEVDPVEHYCRIGWREHRNPAAWFDTAYYLQANADVATSGVNPFWHYLSEGQGEGREPQRPGGFRRSIIESALDPDARTNSYHQAEPKSVLTRARVERLLRAAWEPASGLVLSLSHDCYVRVTGGIQLFIAEEQQRFAGRGLSYIHLSPYAPRLRLVDPAARGERVNLVIDGQFIGVTSYKDVTAALVGLERRAGERRLFLVHCLLGHSIGDVIALAQATDAHANCFWIHDYSSLCVGYTLLRNDVAYCHAPPPDSTACRVCVYGRWRPEHLAKLDRLFDAVVFDVVAPSQAALDIWLSHSRLPHRSATVHPHCDLVVTEDAVAPRPAGQPVRVAFIGYARAHKGWQVWTDLIRRTRRLDAYEFIHIGSHETASEAGGTRHEMVATSAADPDAMVDAVRRLDVDLVLVLSTWPETFSYVTFEAMAGGADVICLRDSGNVADAVLRYGRGCVFDDEESLLAFFGTLRAVEYVRLCQEDGVFTGMLVRHGTTATLDLPGLPLQAERATVPGRAKRPRSKLGQV